MNKTSLKNTTDVDFGRETWFKFHLKDLFLVLCEWFRLGDRSIQVEDSTNRPLGLSKGQPPLLHRGDFLEEMENTVIKEEIFGSFTTHRLIRCLSIRTASTVKPK